MVHGVSDGESWFDFLVSIAFIFVFPILGAFPLILHFQKEKGSCCVCVCGGGGSEKGVEGRERGRGRRAVACMKRSFEQN